MASGAADPQGWRALLSWRGALMVALPVAGVTALHYLTPATEAWVHDLARRLYYIPVILGAFLAGRRGGLSTAVLVSAVYAPHAFAHVHHMDPGRGLEKVLEIVLYLVVGGITGLLVDAERAERRRQAELARRLQATLDDLQETERQLVRSERLAALGRLTAGLAHEIKNPLHAMRGTAEIVQDAIPAGASEARMQALHIGEIDRLTGVLERFLGFARPAVPSLGPVDLRDVAQRLEGLVEAQARRQGATVSLLLGPEPTWVQGDLEQLVQAGLAVALNGLDALDALDGGGLLELAVEPGQRGSHHFHVLRIDNDGPPIPEDMLERIFDPFVTSREEGSGLGLSIAARIVDAHSGWIAGANRPGGGVSFRVWLPIGT
jgi:two-component system, NtrC family, sensor histidine kinase HydH